jgi:hypothetical protein
MKTKRIILAFALAAMGVIAITILHAPSGKAQGPGQNGQGILDVLEQQRQAQAQRLEGSWTMTITAVVPPGVPAPPIRIAYVSFARGGVSILSDRLAPFANPGAGAWQYQGGNEFLWTFIADNFDATGNFLGTLKVRSNINVTGPDTFVGVDNAEVRDAAGNLMLSACNTLRGQRIRAEPLPAQCQSITPPQ